MKNTTALSKVVKEKQFRELARNIANIDVYTFDSVVRLYLDDYDTHRTGDNPFEDEFARRVQLGSRDFVRGLVKKSIENCTEQQLRDRIVEMEVYGVYSFEDHINSYESYYYIDSVEMPKEEKCEVFKEYLHNKLEETENFFTTSRNEFFKKEKIRVCETEVARLKERLAQAIKDLEDAR